jgi:hypothetical protein
MARQVNHGQAMPNVQVVTVVEKVRRSELPKSKEWSPYLLKASSNLRCAMIGGTSLVVRCVLSWSCNPRSGLFCNPSDIQNVIEVAMRNNDPDYPLAIPPLLQQCVPQKVATSDESPVDEVESFRVTQEVEVHAA